MGAVSYRTLKKIVQDLTGRDLCRGRKITEELNLILLKSPPAPEGGLLHSTLD